MLVLNVNSSVGERPVQSYTKDW